MYDDIFVADFQGAVEAFDQMPNDYGLSFDEWMSDEFLKVRRIDMEWMERTNKDESLFHVVWLVPRHFESYLSHIEHKYFPPQTSENNLFRYQLFKWQDAPWIVVTIPIERRDNAFKAAQETNYRLADGVPRVIQHAREGQPIGGKGHASLRCMPNQFMGFDTSDLCIATFPLNSNRVYTLEPQHNKPGPVVGGIAIIKPAPKDFPPSERDPIIDEILKKYNRKRRK